MTLEITVTHDDINSGVGGCPFNCPVALAIKRSVPSSRPYVVADWMEFVERRDQVHFDLPYEVGEFVNQFDRRCEWEHCSDDEEMIAQYRSDHGYDDIEDCEPEGVEPFSFELNLEASDHATDAEPKRGE